MEYCNIITCVLLSLTAVVEGSSLDDIYIKVKNVIHEQSGNYIWVPSTENI